MTDDPDNGATKPENDIDVAPADSATGSGGSDTGTSTPVAAVADPTPAVVSDYMGDYDQDADLNPTDLVVYENGIPVRRMSSADASGLPQNIDVFNSTTQGNSDQSGNTPVNATNSSGAAATSAGDGNLSFNYSLGSIDTNLLGFSGNALSGPAATGSNAAGPDLTFSFSLDINYSLPNGGYSSANPSAVSAPNSVTTQTGVTVTLGYTNAAGHAVHGQNHALVIVTDSATGQQYATRAGPSGGLGSSQSAGASGASAAGGSLSLATDLAISGLTPSVHSLQWCRNARIARRCAAGNPAAARAAGHSGNRIGRASGSSGKPFTAASKVLAERRDQPQYDLPGELACCHPATSAAECRHDPRPGKAIE